MRWFSGCRSCCARDVPTPRALNRITVRIWKLGMLKPAVSACGLSRSAPDLVNPFARMDSEVDGGCTRVELAFLF
eukprot:1802820-Pyramimonas_sp.AAC.2